MSIMSRRIELGTFYRLNTAQLDPEVSRIIDALQNENKYLQQRNEILHQRDEDNEKRVEVLEEVVTDLVHDGKHPEEQQRSQKMKEMREQMKTLETELEAAKSMAGRHSLEMLEKNEALRQNLVEENEALKQKVKELAASKEALKARSELCAQVHDTEMPDAFGDPSVCRILAAGGRCRRGKKCKFGRHPDGY